MIGGTWRGRRLHVREGSAVRPTADRVREALFDILGPRVQGASLLDAYAGTGAIGIEALSRGARTATFVEKDAATLALLRRNLDEIALRPPAAILIADDLARAVGMLEGDEARYDLVYLDPPFGAELDRGLRLIGKSSLLTDESVVVAEHESGQVIETPWFTQARTARYGRVSLTFLTPRAQPV